MSLMLKVLEEETMHNKRLNQFVMELLKKSRKNMCRKRAQEAISFFQQIVPTLPKGARIARDEMERM